MARKHVPMTLDLRARADARDRLLASRLDGLIPMLMDRAGLDAWVLAAREYNEDPVLQTMLPATWLDTARRRTILLFLRTPDGVRRMAVARYAVGDAFPSAWDPEAQPDQWSRLAELLADADPARIGVNSSAVFPLADGLSASERAELVDHLPPALVSRIVSAETAAIGWLETRLPEERALLADACRQSHGYLRRALSVRGDHARDHHNRGRRVVAPRRRPRRWPRVLVPARPAPSSDAEARHATRSPARRPRR